MQTCQCPAAAHMALWMNKMGRSSISSRKPSISNGMRLQIQLRVGQPLLPVPGAAMCRACLHGCPPCWQGTKSRCHRQQESSSRQHAAWGKACQAGLAIMLEMIVQAMQRQCVVQHTGAALPAA